MMADLIDRQALLSDIEEYHLSDGMFQHWVEVQQSVEAEPVVRCKDCKNSEHWYKDRRRCFLWNEDGVSVFDDGFCNYGELKQ